MPTKLNVKSFTPTGTKVVILPDFIKETKSGLIIPDTVKQDTLSPFGTIISVGPGRQTENGGFHYVPFSPGQYVQVMSWRGQPIEVNGEAYLCTDYEVIIGIVEKAPEEPKHALAN